MNFTSRNAPKPRPCTIAGTRPSLVSTGILLVGSESSSTEEKCAPGRTMRPTTPLVENDRVVGPHAVDGTRIHQHGLQNGVGAELLTDDPAATHVP